MSQALSNQTTSGAAIGSGSQTGYGVDTAPLSAGNSLQLTYTDSGNVQHTVTIVALGSGGSLPLQTSPSNPNNQIIGVNFAGGMSGVVSALNAAFGSNLQFSNIRHLTECRQRRQHDQCREFAVGDLDRDVADER